MDFSVQLDSVFLEFLIKNFMEDLIATFMPVGIVVFVLLLISVREVKQYERGVRFTMGKFTSLVEPGWRIVFPIFQKMVKVDIRVKAVDVPDQEAITADNISVTLNAVIYYKVEDASKAILGVENFYYAVSQLAQTTMRNAVGEVNLDELLRNREKIAAGIEVVVDKASDPWGIDVSSVELKDIVISADLKRTMAKVAEAEREKRAVIINSEGEVAASENLAKAATTLSRSPGALHLRTLSSINDISSDASNTTVWMVPIEVLRAVEAIGDKLKK